MAGLLALIWVGSSEKATMKRARERVTFAGEQNVAAKDKVSSAADGSLSAQ